MGSLTSSCLLLFVVSMPMFTSRLPRRVAPHLKLAGLVPQSSQDGMLVVDGGLENANEVVSPIVII